jgi:predicted HTH transcriptional regulator
MANNGPNNSGKIIIGVADKEADKNRVHELDGIEAKKIGQRYVVGVSREAKVLGITIEQYFSKWKDGIRNSDLSIGLRDQVLSNIDFNDFYGLGIITITIPPQTEMSYVGEETYLRSADDTIQAKTPKQVAAIAKRF